MGQRNEFSSWTCHKLHGYRQRLQRSEGINEQYNPFERYPLETPCSIEHFWASTRTFHLLPTTPVQHRPLSQKQHWGHNLLLDRALALCNTLRTSAQFFWLVRISTEEHRQEQGLELSATWQGNHIILHDMEWYGFFLFYFLSYKPLVPYQLGSIKL